MSHSTDSLSILYANGSVQTWELNTKVPDGKGSKLRGGGKVAEPKLVKETTVELGKTVGMALTSGNNGRVAVLARGVESSVITETGDQGSAHDIGVDVERVLYSSNGKLLSVNKAGSFVTGESAKYSRDRI
jgi:elongator complex protein 1